MELIRGSLVAEERQLVGDIAAKVCEEDRGEPDKGGWSPHRYFACVHTLRVLQLAREPKPAQ